MLCFRNKQYLKSLNDDKIHIQWFHFWYQTASDIYTDVGQKVPIFTEIISDDYLSGLIIIYHNGKKYSIYFGQNEDVVMIPLRIISRIGFDWKCNQNYGTLYTTFGSFGKVTFESIFKVIKKIEPLKNKEIAIHYDSEEVLTKPAIRTSE